MWKKVSIAYSECVSAALVIYHAKRVRSILLSSVAYLTVSFVSHYLSDGTTGKILVNMKCVFWFSLQFLSETFIVLRRIHWDITNLRVFSCKVPVTPVRFKINLSFLDRHSKKFSNNKFHENPSSGSRIVPCGQTEGQTETWRSWQSLFAILRTLLIIWNQVWLCQYVMVK